MKIFKFFFLIFISLSAFSQISYGCSCIGTNFIDKSNRALKKFYENPGNAIFTAKVLSVETFEFDEGLGVPFLKKKLTVEIDKYWIGVEDRKMIVKTGMNSGDCGVNFEKGETRFFIAAYNEEKQLWTDSCDYSIFSNLLSNEEKLTMEEKMTKRFTEILGKPKVFK